MHDTEQEVYGLNNQSVFENDSYKVIIENGVIRSFYEKETTINLVDAKGHCGSAGFTWESEDVRLQCEKRPLTPYEDHISFMDSFENGTYYDLKNNISVRYTLEQDGLLIHADTTNPHISQFALNLDLNFLGKKGADYWEQILPSSPYMSEDGRYFYCLMPRPNGRFLLCLSLVPCSGWKIDYSPYCCGHFILNFKLMSSFDKLYGEKDDKKICIKLMCADDIEAAYRAIGKHFHLPLLQNISGGGFCGEAVVRHIGRADAVQVKTPDGSIYSLPAETPLTHIPLQAFGLYTVTPMLDGKHGLNTTLWYGKDYVKLYQKACEAIQKPYHNDENLCEGGCFLWALLNYMRITGDRQFESLVREELAIVMGERDYVARKTIVPHLTEEYAAYHIHCSGRIQEQVFGASILLEAYLLFKESRYLEFAISALREMMEHDMVGGKLLNGSGADYTTVCCPVIPFADMAVCLAELGDNRAEIFKKKAIEMADYLLKRGMDFPTETELTPYTEKEIEDGSISCTALSLLYVCIKVQYNQRYIDFAKQVLHLHKAWTIYTPDVRMYQSSFRWWETIWEGDGEGPAICAGHAWTIWTSEALFYLGLLTRDDEALLASWNGFLTNFSKTQADGSMYSCYEPDYIRGGGIAEVKQTLLQLRGEDTETRYRTAHNYPEHTDNSLSRYAWVRGAYTWQNTAAILLVQGERIGINIQKVNGEWIENNGVTRVYISPKVGSVPLHNQNIQEV